MLLPEEFQLFLSAESLSFYQRLSLYCSPGCSFGDLLRARPKLQVRDLLPGQLERIFDYILNEKIVLEEISMGNAFLAHENIDKWTEYLRNHQLSYKLKTLMYTRNLLPDQEVIYILDAVVGHPSLQMIRFGNFQSVEVLEHLARVLETVPSLIDLDINFCTILDFHPVFTTALKSSKTLNRLTFYSCFFTPESSTALYDILVTNKYIQFLDIGDLETDVDSYSLIMKGIDSNSTLNYFLADQPALDYEDDFKSIINRRKNLIFHTDHVKMSGLYTEGDDYEDILVNHEDFCEERDELCAKLLTISRNLMLLDFPIEIKYHCLDMVMGNYFDIDRLKLSDALLNRNFIGKINAADARKLIQSCYS